MGSLASAACAEDGCCRTVERSQMEASLPGTARGGRDDEGLGAGEGN